MLRVIDHSFSAPAENLAYEEVLLDAAEALEQGGEVLRFWESPSPFVVLGVGQKIAQEAQEKHCVEDGVPILRRCTAGGCVLQGPGSLNYSLVFSFASRPEIRQLHDSYCYILNRIAAALKEHGVIAAHAGICDLALSNGKVSGNAQRRRRKAMLHHGTLLYAPDYAGMARYLQEPKDRPDYRGDRSHADFVAAIPLSAQTLGEAVRSAFEATAEAEGPSAIEVEKTQALAREKYLQEDWIRRR